MQKYEPLLNYFPGFYCQNKDIDLLYQFIETTILDIGTASELPSYSMNEVYICAEESFLKVVSDFKYFFRFHGLLRSIDWGLKNVFYSQEHPDVENNEEYKRVLKQLNDLSK